MQHNAARLGTQLREELTAVDFFRQGSCDDEEKIFHHKGHEVSPSFAGQGFLRVTLCPLWLKIVKSG
jgi:hypothetical protein